MYDTTKLSVCDLFSICKFVKGGRFASALRLQLIKSRFIRTYKVQEVYLLYYHITTIKLIIRLY